MEQIQIHWEGPNKMEEVLLMKNDKKDYGVYQIYGNHVVFGPHSLLYIGKAEEQTFSVRLSQQQEDWLAEESNIEIYVGRIVGIDYKDVKLWCKYIDIAERLLIYYHSPPYNTVYINEPKVEKEFHIMNLGNFARLVPEITTKYLFPRPK